VESGKAGSYTSRMEAAAGEKGAARRITWLGLVDALAAVVGTATLAAFAGRWWWVLELFCHFRVVYVWLLAAWAGAQLFKRRWWRAALFASLAVVNLAAIVPIYLPARAAGESDVRLTALGCNVHLANPTPDRVLRYVRELRPDVAVFLEVTPAWADRLRSLSGKYPHSKVAPQTDAFGMALLSRWPMEEVAVHRLGTIDVPAIVARLNVRGHALTVIAAHPLPPVRRAFAAARNEQLAELAAMARAARGPVLLLGDLNCTSWSPHFSDLVRESGLVDSRQGWGIQPTWPANLPLRIPIDHTLASPSVVVHNRYVGPQTGSDHLSIVVEIGLKK
jgi:endonuclease/exonuclease/phosphatase (EEP) superfamily protein YafD